MNVFEDLIVELKEENLLEDTIIDRPNTLGNGKDINELLPVVASLNGRKNGTPANKLPELAGNGRISNTETYRPLPKAGSIRDRLSEQMASLQLVEAVVGSAERLNGHISPQFDDLEVKKAFHHFAQACSDPDGDEYFDAESILIASMESWQDELSKRDQKVSVEAVRQSVESANPPLSPQALFGMLRFYRSLDISDAVSKKFDFVITRLFSKFVDGERREMLCSQAEIAKHLNQRYLEWGFDLGPSNDAEDPDSTLIGPSLDDFAAEVAGAKNLDALISSNTFRRLSEIKSGAGALIFVPDVAAAAVESNLTISKKVLELIAAESERFGANSMHSRYAASEIALMANALGRSFNIGGLAVGDEYENVAPATKRRSAADREKAKPVKLAKKARPLTEGRRSNLFGINRYLLLSTVLAVVASVGIYVWAEYYSNEPTSSSTVKVVDLEKPEFTKYIKTSKVSGSMLYAVVTPEFEQLSVDQKREFIQKVRQFGVEKGYSRVSLMTIQGKNIGYSGQDKTDLSEH